jgi:hypothetical protein
MMSLSLDVDSEEGFYTRLYGADTYSLIRSLKAAAASDPSHAVIWITFRNNPG